VAELEMKEYQGTVLDNRYLVERKIGIGGVGVVYRGIHTVVGRKVAIKFLNSAFTSQEEIVTRFYREAQTAAAVRHRDIVDILDMGISEEGDPYLVMEYLEGESLSSMLERNGPVNLATACGILEPILLALTASHLKGIIHRDVKPGNIFLVPDVSDASVSVKLIDFSISKLMNYIEDNSHNRDTGHTEHSNLTQIGVALGTPSYMSPEQVMGSSAIDHRTDVYSAGATLFEMLTGVPPFFGESNQETMTMVLTTFPGDPLSLNPEFPPEARPIIARAMRRDPGERYRSASEMLEALRALPAFEDRGVQLSARGSSIIEQQGVVEEPGTQTGSGEDGATAARVWSDISRRHTPGGWTAGEEIDVLFPRRKRGRRALGVMGIGMACLIGVLVYASKDSAETGIADMDGVLVPAAAPEAPHRSAADTRGHFTTASGSAVSAADVRSKGPREVRITVRGTPPGATIRYGERPVTSNAFNATAGAEAVRLEVQAPGFMPYTSEVVPDRDLTLEVEMRRIPVASSASRQLAETPSPPSRAASRSRESGRREYIKGVGQTEIIKNFE
jgi:serine/threonine protein kinase